MTQRGDKGASGKPDRAVVNGAGQAVSAVPASVPSALFAHYHFGWMRHNVPSSSEADIQSALLAKHDFLREYEGKYRFEIKRTPECSYDGRVVIYWDSDEPKSFVWGSPLWRGDYWFTAFEFNVAPENACHYCGGTGIDHYTGPFEHCWACDGTAVQIRDHAWRGFKKKPTRHSPKRFHREYADWLAAQGIEAEGGDAKTGPVRQDESPVRDSECATTPPPHSEVHHG